MNMFKKYLEITKPRIVLSNLISLIGGFLLASKGNINYVLFCFTFIGVLLVVASSCVFNNYIDIDIDSKMERTKTRVLVAGIISPNFALFYATLLGFLGFIILWFNVSKLSFWIGLIGFFIYIFVYSLYMKRKSYYSTIVGSLSGAVPPIIGYCSVTNSFDLAALSLFFIFSLWQIPHSYAISIFRIRDYKIAKIPSLPIVKGISVAKKHIVLHIIAFFIASITLPLNGYVGYKYLIVIIVVNICWIKTSIIGYKSRNDQEWAYKVFLLSIISIILLSIMLCLDSKMDTVKNNKLFFEFIDR